MKADLHAHTHFSRDAVTSIETFAKRYEEAGIDCVAVSDHNNVDGALAVKGIAAFRVIIAEEIKSTEGEIIGLFLQETVRKGLSPEDTVRAIREQNGLVLIPHPYDRLRGSALREEALLRIMPDVDVIEVFNARTVLKADDEKGRRLAEEHGKLMSSATDAHTPWEIGRAYTELPDFDGPESFLQSIAKGKLVGKRSFVSVHFISAWAKIKWRLHLGRRVAQ
ncbi:MAG: PHP domain-containing protein [Chloroflexi bacterium]|nr:PHP domain-containing protein [Chloroflexota bacterium]MCI0855134.1 PHP domain-containing protein [Chloroflexota bacterium]MCI0890506.1 PHP domain-containing protein [Chloroflexota bacterium]